MEDDVISTKAWVGRLLLLCIPLVNIVLLFVWAFGQNTNPNLKTYSRASLILGAVALIVYIILIALIANGASTSLDGM